MDTPKEEAEVRKPDWRRPIVPRKDGTIAVLKGHPSSKKFLRQLGQVFDGLGGGCDVENPAPAEVPSPPAPRLETIHTFERPPTKEWLADFGRKCNEMGLSCVDGNGVELSTYGKGSSTEPKKAPEDKEPAEEPRPVVLDEPKPPVHVVYCHAWRTDGRQDQDDDLLLTSVSSVCHHCHNQNLFVYILLENWSTPEEKELFDNFMKRLSALRDGWAKRWTALRRVAARKGGETTLLRISTKTIPGCIQAEYDSLQPWLEPDKRLKNVMYARWYAPQLLKEDIDANNEAAGYSPYVEGINVGPKLLYLDIDTVVQLDLTHLFLPKTLDGDDDYESVKFAVPVAATQDHYLVWQKRRNPGYVHSAMYLFDVKRWIDQQRCKDCVDFARRSLERGEKAVFTDQDYLNEALKGFIRLLPPQSLAMANVEFYNNGAFTPRAYAETSGMAVADPDGLRWKDIYSGALVLHFAGRDKPPKWHDNLAYGVWRAEYDCMLQTSGVPEFGILIPSSGGERLRGAVRSACWAIPDGMEKDVVVAVSVDTDAGNVPPETEEIMEWARRQPNVVLVSIHRRTGFGPGSNRNFLMDAMRRRCRYFVWLDDDDRFVGQTWLRGLSEELEWAGDVHRSADVACVGAQFVAGGEAYVKLPPAPGEAETFEAAIEAGFLRQGDIDDPGPYVFFEPWAYVVRSCVRFRFAEEFPEDVFGLLGLLDEIHDEPAFLRIAPYLHFVRDDSMSSSAVGRLACAAVPYRIAAHHARPRSALGVIAVRAMMRYFLRFTQNTGVGVAGERNSKETKPNESNESNEQDESNQEQDNGSK